MKWKRGGSDRGLVLVSASGSSDSINQKALEGFGRYLEGNNIGFDVVNLKDFSDIPLLLNKSPIPQKIHDLFSALTNYSHVVIFAPEHNGYFSAFFKNILDWLSLLDISLWKNSKIIIVSASITERDKRVMEAGAMATMARFSLHSVEFINLNKCDRRSLEEMKEIFDEIIVHII